MMFDASSAREVREAMRQGAGEAFVLKLPAPSPQKKVRGWRAFLARVRRG